MISNIKKNNKGYSLVEMVIYISLLSVITIVLVNTVLSFTSSYKELAVLRAIDESAIDVMERLTREIRNSSGVDMVTSSFNSNPGFLTLTTVSGGVLSTQRFYLDDGVVKVDIDGVYLGPLTLSSATITNLVFRKLDNTVSSAIKIEMTISATVGEITKARDFYSTVVMRGS